MQQQHAPGAPGVSPKWTSGAKSGIGKAINTSSSVTFTLSHGILNEIYFPREDIACIRDMEFLVADGKNFFSEEKRHTKHVTKTIKPGVPCYQIINTCIHKKYQLKKEIICDPLRNTVLQHVQFKQAKNTSLQLYALIAPHLNNEGNNNNAWVGEYKGIKMLFAEHKGLALAVACSAKWSKCSAGYVGVSDGWTDLNEHKTITWEYDYAASGNTALIGEIDLSEGSEFVLATGFGINTAEAALHAWGSILEGFESAKKIYVQSWLQWLQGLYNLKGKIYRESAAVLRMHEAKAFPGGIIASLSIPWGSSKDDSHRGGYHVVWPRDLCETANGFIALKVHEDALRVLNYLMSTQQADGSWPQNMWLSGMPYWKGIQMDQTALPILLIDKCNVHNAISKERMGRYWPGIKKAIEFILLNGPYTQQDRWEEEKGYTPFTLATQIAALLAAAKLAEENDEPALATYCLETADYWNDNIEYWTYVTNTPLAKQYNIDGYYIRINPYNIPANELGDKTIELKNHIEGNGKILLNELICVDVLALVRFGLRAPNDPKILDTIKLIDDMLKVTTPYGDSWHRYVNDGYGEDAAGNAYNVAGIGRAWPLLTGERAHYEISAGNLAYAKELIQAMERFSDHSLLPEQIWDTESIPEKDLYFGKHTGSAIPLTWAHAEYIKLSASLKNRKVFDMPEATLQRYIKQKTGSLITVWRFTNQVAQFRKEKILRIELLAAANVSWTFDNWKTVNVIPTNNTTVGLFYVDINIQAVETGKLDFTFFWIGANRWEGKNFSITVI
jgi:glucoamylase